MSAVTPPPRDVLRREPFVPPMQLDGAAAVRMALDDGDDAFEVDEVPAYEPSGSGAHLWLRIRKQGLNTRDVVLALSRASGVSARDIGVAGQKDRHAITSQWLSVGAWPLTGGVPQGPDVRAWTLPRGVVVLGQTWHGNKLRVGHVAANTFRLRFVADDPGGAARWAQAVLDALAPGLANFFGIQRFGRGGSNLEAALRWARAMRSLGGPDARFKETLYASVLQAEVFNRYAAHALADARPLVEGEVVRLAGSRSVFIVEDAARERPRVDARDIVRTGPVFGPKAKSPVGEPAAWESAAIESLDLPEPARAFVGRCGAGTRRDLRVPVEGAGVEVDGRGRLVVRFQLPAGSYATQVVRELTRLAWDAPLRAQIDD